MRARAGRGDRASGHSGAGGQVARADPVSRLSFVFLTGCIDLDFVRHYRRDIAVTPGRPIRGWPLTAGARRPGSIDPG
jgi:CubicO group peptidase (beta-lactamase class C family)